MVLRNRHGSQLVCCLLFVEMKSSRIFERVRYTFVVNLIGRVGVRLGGPQLEQKDDVVVDDCTLIR